MRPAETVALRDPEGKHIGYLDTEARIWTAGGRESMEKRPVVWRGRTIGYMLNKSHLARLRAAEDVTERMMQSV